MLLLFLDFVNRDCRQFIKYCDFIKRRNMYFINKITTLTQKIRFSKSIQNKTFNLNYCIQECLIPIFFF